MICEGCIHYRPFHGKPDSDEYECDLGMEHAYECMSNGFDKKKDRLKPCPFCGADSCNVDLKYDETGEPFIYCATCDGIYTNARDGMESLIDGWNRRVSDGSIQLRRA